MYSEWWISDYKYSLIRELHERGFNELAFGPTFPGMPDTRDETTRFHLTYPLGQFERPCFAIEYNSSLSPGKVGSPGVFAQASTFTVFILGLAGEGWDVERKLSETIRLLHALRVPVYEWNPKVKRFDDPGGKVVQVLYGGDRMNSMRMQSDKPEAAITFIVNH